MYLTVANIYLYPAVVKTQIHPVPEELRVSMSQVLEETVSSSSISSEAATSEKVVLHSEDRGSHGPLSDHPYDVLVGSRIDLETYVLFLQVRMRKLTLKCCKSCCIVHLAVLNYFLVGNSKLTRQYM